MLAARQTRAETLPPGSPDFVPLSFNVAASGNGLSVEELCPATNLEKACLADEKQVLFLTMLFKHAAYELRVTRPIYLISRRDFLRLDGCKQLLMVRLFGKLGP